jgi:trehalose-phosphatase
MQILKPNINIDAFFQQAARAQKRLLLLDYDGTLAPFTPEREKAFPYPGVTGILQQLMESQKTRVVLITGRWSRDLASLLDLERPPEIWGSHGWEKLYPDGTYEIGKLQETALQGLADADAWIESEGLSERAEHKPASLAIHWRGLQPHEVEMIRAKVAEGLPYLAQSKGLQLKEFDGGIELRIPGRDKGYAVASALGEMGEEVAAAYLGDDFTDEDAFAEIHGKGLSVLVREEFRPTDADVWIIPPRELLDFLGRWMEATQ